MPRNVHPEEAIVTQSGRLSAVRRLGLGAALAVLLAPSAVADDAAVARGAYLAAAAGCDNCHTDEKNGGPPYAGGRGLDTEFGTITTPNITPDRATGIGGWSGADFVSAMRWGIAPDGTHYVPAFPFPYFAQLTDADLADLWAYLHGLPPVSRAVPGASLALLARARAAIGLAVTGNPPVSSVPPSDTVAARGAYLVATVGHCGECHTPSTWFGTADSERFLAGAPGGVRGKAAPNITADAKEGIGNWSVEEIAKALKDGETPDFDILGGAMAEIVRNTARLTDDDRHAIAVYLKTLLPKTLAKNR